MHLVNFSVVHPGQFALRRLTAIVPLCKEVVMALDQIVVVIALEGVMVVMALVRVTVDMGDP